MRLKQVISETKIWCSEWWYLWCFFDLNLARKSTVFSTIWRRRKSIQNTSGTAQVLSAPLPTVNTFIKDWSWQALQRSRHRQFPNRHRAGNHKAEHDKPQKKCTHWTTIWCTVKAEKARIGARFVAGQAEKKQHIVLAPAKQQTRPSRMKFDEKVVWFMFDIWFDCDFQSQMASDSHVLFLLIWCAQTARCLDWADLTSFAS